MSTKKSPWFGKKKVQMPKQEMPQPRQRDVIDAELNEVANRAYKAQYTMYVYEKELAACNDVAIRLNQEAAARNALDKAATQAAPTTTGATNEQA